MAGIQYDKDGNPGNWYRNTKTGGVFFVPLNGKNPYVSEPLKFQQNNGQSIKRLNSKEITSLDQLKKGIPLSIEDAVSDANPNYGNGKEYEVNCQRCVQAYELRRRGYNVIAKAYEPNSGVEWGNECFGLGKHDYKFGKDRLAIIKLMQDARDGERYSIYGIWSGKPPSAHVFIAEKSGNDIRYVDPQNGNSNCKSYLNRMVSSSFGYCRLDDKQLTNDIGIISKTVEVLK